jgi:hypothetical protein
MPPDTASPPAYLWGLDPLRTVEELKLVMHICWESMAEDVIGKRTWGPVVWLWLQDATPVSFGGQLAVAGRNDIIELSIDTGSPWSGLPQDLIPQVRAVQPVAILRRYRPLPEHVRAGPAVLVPPAERRDRVDR